MSLRGKVAIVTGASKGIGREIALELASEGAKVVLVSRNEERMRGVANEIENKQDSVLIIPTDVTDEQAVSAMVGKTIDTFGKIDILVNNAGDPGPTTAVQDLKMEDWNSVVDSSLTGSFLCAKYVVPCMIQENQGRIINISSATAKSGLAYRVGYTAAKAGMIGFSRSLALELGPNNICVNTILPGAVEGDRLDYVIAEQAKKRGVPADKLREVLLKDYPLGRAVNPEDIAKLVAFLSGDAGKNITGEDINVTAGGVMG